MSTCSEPGCRRRCLAPHTRCVAHRPKVRSPSGYSPEAYARRQAERTARQECRVCWVVGGHDPLCRKGGLGVTRGLYHKKEVA